MPACGHSFGDGRGAGEVSDVVVEKRAEPSQCGRVAADALRHILHQYGVQHAVEVVVRQVIVASELHDRGKRSIMQEIGPEPGLRSFALVRFRIFRERERQHLDFHVASGEQGRKRSAEQLRVRAGYV